MFIVTLMYNVSVSRVFCAYVERNTLSCGNVLLFFTGNLREELCDIQLAFFTFILQPWA